MNGFDPSPVFNDTIKQIEVNRVLYGGKPGANDPFKGEWPGQHRCCGGFVTTAMNRALRAAGAPDNSLLPASNLGTGIPKHLAEATGSQLVNKFSPETLRQLGPGTVIAGYKPGGGDHAEMVVNHPVTGELVVASYGRPGKTIQYKQIDDKYADYLNRGRFQATNPFGGGRVVGGQVHMAGGAQNDMMQYMASRGLPPEIAAGMLGNAHQETGGTFDPKIVNKKSGAYGLFQWLGPRKKALFNFAKDQGRDVNDWRTQVDFALHELQSDPSWGWESLQQARDPRDAAQIFSRKFERAGAQETNDANRIKQAMAIYQGYTGAQSRGMVADASGQTVPVADQLQAVAQPEQKPPMLDLAALQAGEVLTPFDFGKMFKRGDTDAD